MDDQTFPSTPPDRPQANPVNPGESSQSAPLPHFSQPLNYPPNPAQPPYPYPAPPAQPGNPYPQPTPPSQPLSPPDGQPNPVYSQPGQPASASYPMYGPPNYAPPSLPLYPQSGPLPQQPQPPKRGLKAWQWVVIAVGISLVLCCSCGVFAVLINGTNPSASGSQNAALGTSVPTDTPTPAVTATPQPTATLAATATPVPPGIGDHMALGHNYGQNANGFYIINPADTFSSAQQFAFAVNLDQRIGTTQAKLALVKELSGGAESVVFSAPMNIPNPDYSSFANKLATSTLMYGQTPGKYKLEMETDTAVVASASFTYTG
jgi:hypothetical protein